MRAAQLSLSGIGLALAIAISLPVAMAGGGGQALPPETIEADVSARSVSVEADFTGTEIVVFGTVENSRQPSAEAGTYDIIIVVEGTSVPHVMRRKSNIGGIWINTKSVRFASLPSYYAIASTRPIADITDGPVLTQHEIGLDYVRMVQSGGGRTQPTDAAELEEFRKAVVRLKQRDGLYVQSDYAVAFVGRSLFRTTIKVPPNVPIGALKAKVYLFREGVLLGEYASEVALARVGIERFLHDFAHRNGVWYGLGVVLFAVGAGLASSFAFRRD